MIEVKHLTKKYGSGVAVSDLSFKVESGKIYGFLGPNGAGKSTTMNIIAGCLAPTEGQVLIGGYDICEEPDEAKRLIGYLPEQPPLYPDMTPEEYLTFVGRAKGLRGAELHEEIEYVMDATCIGGMRSRLIKNLSKGYKQRVGIAQALVGNPRVIILDEPTVGLDPKEIIEIRNLIRTLGETHTVILSTHILTEVQAVCDRILIINSGKLIADERTENIAKMIEGSRRLNARICGPQRDVLRVLRSINEITTAEVFGDREGDSFVYSIESSAGVDIRKPLFYTLSKNNMPLIGLEQQGTNLEDIFISLVDKPKDAKTRRKDDAPKFDVKPGFDAGADKPDDSDDKPAYDVLPDSAEVPESKEEENNK